MMEVPDSMDMIAFSNNQDALHNTFHVTSSADDRLKLFNFLKLFTIPIFIAIIRFSIKNAIKMSTNKPSIGAVVLENLIPLCILRK